MKNRFLIVTILMSSIFIFSASANFLDNRDDIKILAIVWAGKNICKYEIIDGSFDRFAIKSKTISLWTYGNKVDAMLPETRSWMIYSRTIEKKEVCNIAITVGEIFDLIRVKSQIETLKDIPTFASNFLYILDRCKLQLTPFGENFISDIKLRSDYKLFLDSFSGADKYWEGIGLKELCSDYVLDFIETYVEDGLVK
ncbi:MAG: hypothetical protein HRU28_05500 [Rhizobiales bacterium]|nr:hypothetical protein [Hyphomicrobiales bacterium]